MKAIKESALPGLLMKDDHSLVDSVASEQTSPLTRLLRLNYKESTYKPGQVDVKVNVIQYVTLSSFQTL
jgi:hypothetical protein